MSTLLCASGGELLSKHLVFWELFVFELVLNDGDHKVEGLNGVCAHVCVCVVCVRVVLEQGWFRIKK